MMMMMMMIMGIVDFWQLSNFLHQFSDQKRKQKLSAQKSDNCQNWSVFKWPFQFQMAQTHSRTYQQGHFSGFKEAG